jgi:16S rRNA (guanine527-N7)-methyltransferase
VDLGSGAGLPGIPLGIIRNDLTLVLVDSNSKKAAFLREAVRITHVSATIVAKRIEQLTSRDLAAVPEVIVSRAAAPLQTLLDWTNRIAGPQTLCLFHKGQDVDAQLTAATKCWRFDLVRHSSRVQNDSWILEIRNVARIE